MVTHFLSVLAPLIATSRNGHVQGTGFTGSLSHLPYAITLACIAGEAVLGVAILAVGLFRFRHEHQHVSEPGTLAH